MSRPCRACGDLIQEGEYCSCCLTRSINAPLPYTALSAAEAVMKTKAQEADVAELAYEQARDAWRRAQANCGIGQEHAAKQPPLVKGGQGRSDEEVYATGDVFCRCVIAASVGALSMGLGMWLGHLLNLGG